MVYVQCGYLQCMGKLNFSTSVFQCCMCNLLCHICLFQIIRTYIVGAGSRCVLSQKFEFMHGHSAHGQVAKSVDLEVLLYVACVFWIAERQKVVSSVYVGSYCASMTT